MIRRFLRRLERQVALKLAVLVRSVEDEVSRSRLPRFANSPVKLRIEQPSRIVNAGNITIGDHVSLGPGCMINAIRRYPGPFMAGAPDNAQQQEFNPEIRIGNRVSATGYLTIGAVMSVVIEDDVLLASHIFISDNQHGYRNIDIPFKYQPLERIAPVVIGHGCWIGEHVVIMSGVTIGRYSIIGANSVVTSSVPPKCIAVGAPAKVIREWSDNDARWVKPGEG